jgi:GNAT superfamily N-acetyltransferase
MADRALFIGFGQPVRGREERAVEVFNEFVEMFGRMQSDGRIDGIDVALLDPHGGDLGGFFMVHGSGDQCAALSMDEEFRRASIDASLIVENFGVVPAATGEGVGTEMAQYVEALKKVGVGGHALAAAAHNGG